MIPWLSEDDRQHFPPVERALRQPNGLLCAGGDLSVERLVSAYRAGIFPWFSDDDPLLWWSPDPRAVLPTDAFHASRSLQRSARRLSWQLQVDQHFDAVIAACAEPRDADGGTWIVPGMQAAFRDLHRHGHAHSFELLVDGALVGGTYGVAVGGVFCAESMYSRIPDASKITLWQACLWLRARGVELIDAQFQNPHLVTLGFREWPRRRYIETLMRLRDGNDAFAGSEC